MNTMMKRFALASMIAGSAIFTGACASGQVIKADACADVKTYDVLGISHATSTPNEPCARKAFYRSLAQTGDVQRQAIGFAALKSSGDITVDDFKQAAQMIEKNNCRVVGNDGKTVQYRCPAAAPAM